jgi:hypothetical protein
MIVTSSPPSTPLRGTIIYADDIDLLVRAAGGESPMAAFTLRNRHSAFVDGDSYTRLIRRDVHRFWIAGTAAKIRAERVSRLSRARCLVTVESGSVEAGQILGELDRRTHLIQLHADECRLRHRTRAEHAVWRRWAIGIALAALGVLTPLILTLMH